MSAHRDAPLSPKTRSRLFGLAYRMLGSGSDAEDILQEAQLRLLSAEDVRDAPAWLTTCVTRLCIDELRSARRRREVYVGPWLPEPERSFDDPHRESLSIAFLHLLERLNAKERAVLILHDVFDFKHREIADIVQVSVEASRKTLSRARSHMKAPPRFAPDEAAHSAMLLRFVAAVQEGDVGPLMDLLADDAAAITDAGGTRRAALRELSGARNIARFFIGLAKKSASTPELAPLHINGWPALRVRLDGMDQIVVIETDGVEVQTVFVLMNASKLTRI